MDIIYSFFFSIFVVFIYFRNIAGDGFPDLLVSDSFQNQVFLFELNSDGLPASFSNSSYVSFRGIPQTAEDEVQINLLANLEFFLFVNFNFFNNSIGEVPPRKLTKMEPKLFLFPHSNNSIRYFIYLFK